MIRAAIVRRFLQGKPPSFSSLSALGTVLSPLRWDPWAQSNPIRRLSATSIAVNPLETVSNQTVQQEDTSPLDLSLESSVTSSLPTWLRPYQIDVIQHCVNALDRGLERIGVSSPTGSGKTVMFTHLIPFLLARGEPGGSVLVLVGNIELARQAFATIENSHPEYTVELEQGTSAASGRADVTIATYQTLRQDARLAKYDPSRFKGVIVDEAHHAAAPSYMKLLSHFNSNVRSFDPETKSPIEPPIPTTHASVPIIGFTATFSRHDQLALSRVFEEIVYHQDVIDMLKAGWLAPARFTTVKAKLDLSSVSVSSSTKDFSATSLAAVMNTPAVNEFIVKVYLDRASDRRSTLVFCVDLAHVADMTATFREAGIDARNVTGNTKDSERKALVDGFKAGEFPVMVNCQLFTEGTDIPNIDCIIVARPTRSRNLFSQMIGRGLRHSAGKEDCRIIDLVDNAKKTGGLVSAPTLFGLEMDADVEDETAQSLIERAQRSREELVQGEQDEEDPDIQLQNEVSYLEDDDPFRLDDGASKEARGCSKYAWVSCGDSKYILDAFGTEFFSIIKANGLYQVRHAHQFPRTNSSKGKKYFGHGKWTIFGRAETLEQAFGTGDALVEKMVSRTMLSKLSRWADWRRRPPTPSQINMLERMGLLGDRPAFGEETGFQVVNSGYTSGQVASMLTAMKHGAKGRSEKVVKQKTQAERIKDKEALRQAAQVVKVGPLAPSSA